jgi:protein-tyrosine-phosphatase
MPSILFVCVANSCRSQMAEAAARRADPEGRWDIWSAGSHPSGRVHPAAIEAMRELGVDLSAHRSKGLHDVPRRVWDYVVTMGCGDACPAVQAAHRLDWQIPDPVGLPPEQVRAIRDDLIRRVEQVIKPAGRVPA